MARVEVLLSDKEKSNLKNVCQTKGICASTFIRTLINQSSPDIAINAEFHEVKTNKITIRLSETNLHLVATKAKAEGYINQTNWATAAVMANLHQEPVLASEEITALRDSNRQLAAMGRNLNQIARVLNIEFRESDKITKEMIDIVYQQFQEHIEKVYQLLTKNRTRWNITDDTAH